MEDIAWENGLYLTRQTIVFNRENDTPKRILAIFERERRIPYREKLILRDEKNEYTEEFKNLCRSFYLHF